MFADSGAIEAGREAAIGDCLRQSGMFWTVRGANPVVALCSRTSTGNWNNIGRNSRVV